MEIHRNSPSFAGNMCGIVKKTTLLIPTSCSWLTLRAWLMLKDWALWLLCWVHMFVTGELECGARVGQDQIHALNRGPCPVTELEGKQSCNHSQFLALTLLVVEPAWLWIVGAPYCHHFAFSASAKATTFILSLLVCRKGDQRSQCKTGCRSLTPASN